MQITKITPGAPAIFSAEQYDSGISWVYPLKITPHSSLFQEFLQNVLSKRVSLVPQLTSVHPVSNLKRFRLKNEFMPNLKESID